jgi:hypothetical protein
MEASGCPLSEAFGEIEPTKIKKKSKKERRRNEQIYSEELKPIDSRFQESSNVIQGYDNNNSHFDINGPTETYGFHQQIQDNVNNNIAHPVQRTQPVINNPHVSNPSVEHNIIDTRKSISDNDYREFQEFQRKKHFENHQQRLSQLEGFSNVNDDFNDVLLFGLMGVFFLIFTDYIYKLGKKSY